MVKATFEDPSSPVTPRDFTHSSPSQSLPEDKFPKREDPNIANTSSFTVGDSEQDAAVVNEYADLTGDETALVTYFLSRSRKCFEESTNYLDTSLRRRWDDNLRLFRSEHASGSKYNRTDYTGRSKLFRPKTRAALKNGEAAMRAAVFTNLDMLSAEAQDPSNIEAQDTARIVKELVQYRFENTIPWKLTVLGAWQDTNIFGICVSRQEWQYRTRIDSHYVIEFDENNRPVLDETGAVQATREDTQQVLMDRPWIAHIQPELFRFDVNADWRDVVGTSPFLIEDVPMSVSDVEEMMSIVDDKTGRPFWRRVDKAKILIAGREAISTQDESTQQARAGRQRQKPTDQFTGDEYAPVYVRINILREDGIDWIFWSLGSACALTIPVPVSEVSILGRHMYRVGFSNLEAHRTYPSSAVEMGAPLQEGINEITNQRRDNVGLALNKRYFIKRQKQGAIDLKALMRNVPGGGVLVDDPEDVKVVETNDVTASSYTEQDRLSNEYDELAGNFSAGTMAANPKIAGQVGTANLASSGANSVQEMSIDLFIETWMQPVCQDIAKLIQHYETDEVVLAIAGARAKLIEKLRTAGKAPADFVTEDNLVIKINVGMGNTNPAFKVEKLTLALNTIAQYPRLQRRLMEEEIGKEIFSFVGYSDGRRFLVPEEELPPEEEQIPPEVQVKLKQLELDTAKFEWQKSKDEAEREDKRELAFAELALKEKMTLSQIEATLDIAIRKDKTIRETAALRETNKSTETLLKHDEAKNKSTSGDPNT
jgi:hypothetical protein